MAGEGMSMKPFMVDIREIIPVGCTCKCGEFKDPKYDMCCTCFNESGRQTMIKKLEAENKRLQQDVESLWEEVGKKDGRIADQTGTIKYQKERMQFLSNRIGELLEENKEYKRNCELLFAQSNAEKLNREKGEEIERELREKLDDAEKLIESLSHIRSMVYIYKYQGKDKFREFLSEYDLSQGCIDEISQYVGKLIHEKYCDVPSPDTKEVPVREASVTERAFMRSV